MSTPSDYEDEMRLRLTHLETYKKHVNLDDMDFGDDGVVDTLMRVVGRRGLGVWRVERECKLLEAGPAEEDGVADVNEGVGAGVDGK